MLFTVVASVLLLIYCGVKRRALARRRARARPYRGYARQEIIRRR